MSNIVMCPHCGRVVNLRDPKMAHLSPATFAVWEQIKGLVRRGERFGSTRAGRIAGMTPQAADRHLDKLVQAGLLVREPKGKYQVYVRKDE